MTTKQKIEITAKRMARNAFYDTWNSAYRQQKAQAGQPAKLYKVEEVSDTTIQNGVTSFSFKMWEKCGTENMAIHTHVLYYKQGDTTYTERIEDRPYKKFDMVEMLEQLIEANPEIVNNLDQF